MFSLDQFPLPFDAKSVEPYMSRQTLYFHHDKHLGAYIKNLNDLIINTKYEKLPLYEIVKQSAADKNATGIFNNSAQVFNHNFFFHCLANKNAAKIPNKIVKLFGGSDKFKSEFVLMANSVFGSGWVWLVKKSDNKFEIIKTQNADTPLAHDMQPILTLDLWEHAYYLDYQNKRAEFIKNFLNYLVNWDFVAENIKL